MTEQLRQVLIFAHECAPYHRAESTIGAQRPAQFAKYLPEFGWRAIVVCCDARRRRSGKLEGLEQEIRAAIRDSDPGKSVIIPTPSLPHDGLVDRWWHAYEAPKRSGRWPQRLSRKVLTAAKLFTGDYSQSWQPCAWKAAQVIQQETSLSACIAEHSPDAGLFLARRFAELYRVPWIADFRDPILQPLRPLTRRLYAPIARRLLRTAAGCINVNEVWANLDHQLFGLPSWSIPNGFDPDEFPALPDALPDGDHFVIAYMGNIIAEQQIDGFFEGLCRLKAILPSGDFQRLRFLYRGTSPRIREFVEKYGLAEIADLGGPVSRPAVLALLRHAHLLLLLSIANYSSTSAPYYAKGIYPGKTFEYFGLRRPILCVPGDRGLLDQLIRETNTGSIASTPESIADYLASAFQNWKAGRTIPYHPNELVIERYTRRNLSQQLATILDRMASRSPDQFCASTGQREQESLV